MESVGARNKGGERGGGGGGGGGGGEREKREREREREKYREKGKLQIIIFKKTFRLKMYKYVHYKIYKTLKQSKKMSRPMSP